MKSIILIVEDNDDLRNAVSGVLTDHGYEVHDAPNGAVAMSMLESVGWTPDLIVSDIMMPVMNGYEFFEAVHRIPSLRSIPFIFLTALGARSDQQAARRMGVDDYLVKPFEPDDFLIAIENRLRRAAEMRMYAHNALDDARRTMVQLLSHELRTPLTYVSGGFQLLAEELRRGELDPTMEMSLGLIESGTTRLTRLTDQMILYAQLAAGHVQVQMETAGVVVNIRNVVDQALHQLKPLITDRAPKLHYVPPTESVTVFGIAELLTSAVNELFRNAITYSSEGGPIWINLYAENGAVHLIVADHGSGILPEDMPTIWNVLVQSDRIRREQQGAGMGLPIARRVVEAHGGTINLQSILVQGTTVTVKLPLI